MVDRLARRASEELHEAQRKAEFTVGMPGRVRRGLIGFVALAVAAIAVVIGVQLLVGPADDEAASPTTAVPSTTRPTSTTVPTPTTVPFAVVVGEWTRVPDPGGVFRAETFVERVPSGDGSTLSGSSGMSIWSMVDTPEGTVAVGSEEVGLLSIAAVWVSDNGGVTWARVPHDDEVFGGLDHDLGGWLPSGPAMREVVFANGRFIALGTDTTTSPVPVAWYSDDGRTWVRVPAEVGPQPGDGFTSVAGVVAAGPGLVAVGGVSDPNRNAFTAVVWTSEDGETWNTYDAFAAETDPIITDLAVLDGSIIAVGGHWNGDAAGWISDDGLTWQPAAIFDSTGEPPGEMVDVAVGPQGAVAVGQAPVSGQAPHDLAIWVTADGRTWERVDPTAAFRARQSGPITWGPAGFVTAASAVFDPRASSYIDESLILRSVDGRAWEELPGSIAGAASALAIVDGHYLAAGSVLAADQLDPDLPIVDGAIWIADLE